MHIHSSSVINNRHHLLFIFLDSGLVKRVNLQQIPADGACFLEKVNQIAVSERVDFWRTDDDVRHAALRVGDERSFKGGLIDRMHRLFSQII